MKLARLEQKVGQLTMDLDWLKKKSRQLGVVTSECLNLMSPAARLSVKPGQYELLGVSRSSYYLSTMSRKRPESAFDAPTGRVAFTQHPVYAGVRALTALLQREGLRVNEKAGGAVDEIINGLGGDLLQARHQPDAAGARKSTRIYCGTRPSQAPDQVWCADITWTFP